MASVDVHSETHVRDVGDPKMVGDVMAVKTIKVAIIVV